MPTAYKKHFDKLIAKSIALNEPYLTSVYKRAAKLAVIPGKHKEINQLLTIAHETILNARQRKPERQAKIAHRNQLLKNLRQRKKNLRLARRPTLNNFMLNHVEQIKHKRQSLLQFLKNMYESNMRYNDNTKKWYKV